MGGHMKFMRPAGCIMDRAGAPGFPIQGNSGTGPAVFSVLFDLRKVRRRDGGLPRKGEPTHGDGAMLYRPAIGAPINNPIPYPGFQNIGDNEPPGNISHRNRAGDNSPPSDQAVSGHGAGLIPPL